MQEIAKLVDAGYITGVNISPEDGYLNSASIDLPLSGEAFRLEGSFLPGKGQHIRTCIKRIGGERHDLSSPLERGIDYLVRIEGQWSLPDTVYAYANPKSSTGRLNVLSRLVADNSNMFDQLPRGWKMGSEMWLLIRADSFPVRVYEGLALSQLRLFTGKAFLSPYDMEVASRKYGLIFDPQRKKISFRDIELWGDSVVLSIDVSPEFGYEARGTHKPLDLAKKGNKSDYFEAIRADSRGYLLRKGSFYILSSREPVMVPPHLSAELRGIDYRFGDMQVHRAGYIDSGWGYGKKGEVKGRPITLEVTPNENIFVEDGQAIARLRYEHMFSEPDVPYDSAKSNYTEQKLGAMLSKYLV